MNQFDGNTFSQARDGARLSKQLDAVKTVMLDGQWHTLAELAETAHASDAAVSARVRDLRKAKFGGYTVDRLYIRRGIWAYRIACSTVPLQTGTATAATA
jgi:biotin operon repressor